MGAVKQLWKGPLKTRYVIRDDDGSYYHDEGWTERGMAQFFPSKAAAERKMIELNLKYGLPLEALKIETRKFRWVRAARSQKVR